MCDLKITLTCLGEWAVGKEAREEVEKTVGRDSCLGPEEK